MSDRNTRSFEKGMQSLGWWYQHFEFPNGVRTGSGDVPGYDARKRWAYIEAFVPSDLTGKTVLDIGGNAGFFSIQMKLRGAQRCVLVDPFEIAIKQARFAAEQFGVALELVTEDAHTYCLTTEERFDYVLFLGLFYHLKYPGIVLDRLAEMTRERIFIQSNVIGLKREPFVHKPDYERDRDDRLLEHPGFPRLVFLEAQYNEESTNWWIPNLTGIEAMVRSAGLRVIDRPHPHIIIAAPEIYYGKEVFPKLVFPKYGKRGGAILPGSQRYDAEEWINISKAIADRPRRTRNFLVERAWQWIRRLYFLYIQYRGRLVSRFRQ